MLKDASRCGGVKPHPPHLEAMPGTHDVADPGKAAYAAVVKRLLEMEGIALDATLEQKRQIITLRSFSDESLGECCAAALAAANIAYNFEVGKGKTSWSTLKGGVCAAGDLPTLQ